MTRAWPNQEQAAVFGYQTRPNRLTLDGLGIALRLSKTLFLIRLLEGF